jgi:hypothetical protein
VKHIFIIILSMRREERERDIPRCTAESLQQSPLLILPRKPEISQLDPTPLIKQHILKLNIPMHNPPRMRIPHRKTKLSENPPRLILAQSTTLFLDEIVE